MRKFDADHTNVSHCRPVGTLHLGKGNQAPLVRPPVRDRRRALSFL